jgi:membrane-associated protease RseP (regulator of RpoE activity)
VYIIINNPQVEKKRMKTVMAGVSFWQKTVFRFFIMVIVGQSLLGCAAPHLFQQWDARLIEMTEAPRQGAFYTKEDVSLLLGSSPSKCETLPSAGPKIGILIDPKQPVVTLVVPNSPAYATGIRTGFVILAVNGKPTTSVQTLIQVLRAETLVNVPINIHTDHGLFKVVPSEPRFEQCYWDIRSGRVARSGGVASWGGYGGSAVTGSDAYERFYRATCRFQDGILIQFQSNWQM